MMVFCDRVGPAGIVVGDDHWLFPAAIIAAAGVILTFLLNRRRLAVAGIACLLRILGWLLIAGCLVNPLWSGARPRQGANVFAVVVDNSRSQTVSGTNGKTRSEAMTGLLKKGERLEPPGWLHRIDKHFELRRYTLSGHLQRTSQLSSLDFDGVSSRLQTGLTRLTERFRGQPLAGVLLFTDGNATDIQSVQPELTGLAPVYPVVARDETLAPDLAITMVTPSQSAFDDAPVTVQVQTVTQAPKADAIRTTLLDPEGTPITSQARSVEDDSPVRLQARPTKAGTVFYRVRSELLDKEGRPIDEATEINNSRLIAVDRGSEPRRVLYVSGRPNWEYKFLRRAVETDARTELVALIRIAKKEAKFEFRGRSGERSNSLFRGFEADEQEVAEEYDEPVLVRLGTKDDDELLSGFPEKSVDLFRYDAVILDDIEADFFTVDQHLLIREFVSRRGGGFLMLGGQESFRQGEYDRTPIGEMLPVELRRSVAAANGPVRLSLTREGWLQPWVRLRSDEEDERLRLQSMSFFRTLNPTQRTRPGAQVMATVTDSSGKSWPALVVQRFGRGHTAALCIGDFWRWRLHEGLQQYERRRRRASAESTTPWDQLPEEDRGDFARSIRQMVRWLVSEVPRRLTVTSSAAPGEGIHSLQLSARVRDLEFHAREDAKVIFQITRPDGTQLQLSGRPASDEIGRFDAHFLASTPGAWQCTVTAILENSEGDPEELSAAHGWACQPDQREMASVQLNTKWLAAVAEQTGGRLIQPDELDSFVEELETAHAPVMEKFFWPLWNQWTVFLAALGCFLADWTIRRRLGVP